MAIASLVLGIASIIFCWIPILGAALSITALIISIVALANKANNGEQTGFKVAGLILSIFSTLVAIFMTIAIVAGMNFAVGFIDDIFGGNQSYFIDKETQELSTNLTKEYIEIKVKYSMGRPITAADKEEVRKKYMEVLKNDHPQLFKQGYTVEVQNDLMYKIVEPVEK